MYLLSGRSRREMDKKNVHFNTMLNNKAGADRLLLPVSQELSELRQAESYAS